MTTRQRLDTDALLDRVDLLALVQQAGGKPRKSGASWRCACPLHGGDNASSFSVFMENGRQLWKCHTGEGKHRRYAAGNAIHFVMEQLGTEWIDAVKHLADRERIPLEQLGLTPEAIKEHQQREIRADVLELAAQFYAQYAIAHPEAQAYAKARGFVPETVERFGFSNGNGIAKFLREKKADLSLAREIGLLRSDGRDFTDNGNGREASPDGWLVYVHRAAGRVVSLSARAITPAARMPDPKDKSRNLPGTRHIYRAEAKGDDNVIIVEGQADAESYRQAGRSAWALCGAALTERDLVELKRRKNTYLALDADVKLERVEQLAGELGPLTLIPPALPEATKDGNAWLQAGTLTPEALAGWLAGARPFIELAVAQARNCPAHELSERTRALIALIAKLPEGLRGKYLNETGQALNMPVRDLRAQLTLYLNQEGGDLVRADIRDGRIYYDGLALANFQARITHQLTLDDGQNAPETRYTITGALASGAKLRPLEVPSEEFMAGKWLSRWGARAMLHVPPRQYWQLMLAIQSISSDEMKDETIHTYSGWSRLNGEPAYLTTSGAITAEGLQPSARVELGHEVGNLRHYRLPAPPEKPKEAIRESLRFLDLAPDHVSVPIWLGMYGAPLTVFRSLDAVLWVYGATQSKKSTLTMLALTHFGPGFINGTKFRAPMDWLSTFTAIEGALFTAKDVPMVIDDYTPQATDDARRRLLKTAQDVIRTVGNRSTRGRASGDLSMRAPRPPRGLVIATSEKQLEVQSTVGRMVYVTIERGDVKTSEKGDSPLDKAQHTNGEGGPGLYAQSMAAYVQWMARNWEAVKSVSENWYEQYNTQARSLFAAAQGRMMDIYASLRLTGHVVCDFAEDAGAITSRQRKDYDARIDEALVKVLREHSLSVGAQSPARRLCEALHTLVAQRRVYLAPRLADSGTYSPPDRAVLVGWYERESPVLYLLPEACLQQVRDFYARSGESFDTLIHALTSEFLNGGFVCKRDADRSTAKLFMGTEHGTMRVLALNADKLYIEYGVWLWRKDREPQEATE